MLTLANAVAEALTIFAAKTSALASTLPPSATPSRSTSARAVAFRKIASKLSATKSAATSQKSQTLASRRPSAKEVAIAKASAVAIERPLRVNDACPSAH